MPVNTEKFKEIRETLKKEGAVLVAVSKTKPVEDILSLYEMGQRDFGENYVQELLEKQAKLPSDIRWHFIGHLQTNKVKYIAPFVHLIHGVDSEKLLNEIDKQAKKAGRKIHVLLQVHIAQEETKFGMDENELSNLLVALQSEHRPYQHIQIEGLMGMASFSNNETVIRNEFRYLRSLHEKYGQKPLDNCHFQVLSMGMSSDYQLALKEGSTMVRIGSSLFGARS